MDDTNTLIAALKAAGHETQAKDLQIEELKKQATALGRDDVVELLEGGTPSKPASPTTPDQAPAQAVARAIDEGTDHEFLKQIQDAASGSWTSIPLDK